MKWLREDGPIGCRQGQGWLDVDVVGQSGRRGPLEGWRADCLRCQSHVPKGQGLELHWEFPGGDSHQRWV
eukprot:6243904-Pyramimonas_sp.AAC.1